MQPAINPRVLAFALVTSCVTALAFGLFPALRLTRTASARALKEGGAAALAGRWRTGSSLVAAEVCLATVLLVGAGLMLRSLHKLLSIPLGFEPQRVLVVEAIPVMTGEDQPARARRFYRELVGRLA